MFSPMQKPFRDGKGFYLRQMYKKVHRMSTELIVTCTFDA